ncbi:hypothetical protein E3T26_14930 [Cryobacterium sp. TMT1-21]|uniref:Uncharacterized protein n=1 Tax=Cryobacterium shii TaxID=1259235 RepID=A0AAQ2C946_9MICO|nr:MULTISPECIES: hypothetical protein [Cryobacterium]TFC52901.1 hypothetical protein E3O49_00675 [Cryobacterium shii]TFC81079.1 hypothetical protein E3T24_15340 [Cryobacterium sp. TmT2-59]TFD09050.1 hypothetical protein E3T26_14930 [Cryobacterium sp. TMT1-21]TFD15621.1 hypothetical protein E3T42_10220 [Cryobacterium sp. TMT4-10]TFD21943.1 hypothetical protein E3T32_07180 [Cryobacterium sp. TMT2-23]
MRRISYSGASFLTADAIADALFQLVTALGISQTTESLNLPAINVAGKPIMVKLIVGPMSELISVPEDSLWDEPNITEVIAVLRDRVLALQQPKPSPAYAEIATTDFDSSDFNSSDTGRTS